MTKCEFTIYKGVSEHKCEQKKGKYHTFYEQGGANKTDRLKTVVDPKNYAKRRIRVQCDCNCEKTVRLSIVNQLARSIYFNPETVYNYTDKIEIYTDFGFSWWLHENTREIQSKSDLVESFVADLMPGTTFYDGLFMTRIANDCSTITPQSHILEAASQEDHRCNFVKLIRFCSDLTRDSFVVNKIIRPREDLI